MLHLARKLRRGGGRRRRRRVSQRGVAQPAHAWARRAQIFVWILRSGWAPGGTKRGRGASPQTMGPDISQWEQGLAMELAHILLPAGPALPGWARGATGTPIHVLGGYKGALPLPSGAMGVPKPLGLTRTHPLRPPGMWHRGHRPSQGLHFA